MGRVRRPGMLVETRPSLRSSKGQRSATLSPLPHPSSAPSAPSAGVLPSSGSGSVSESVSMGRVRLPEMLVGIRPSLRSSKGQTSATLSPLLHPSSAPSAPSAGVLPSSGSGSVSESVSMGRVRLPEMLVGIRPSLRSSKGQRSATLSPLLHPSSAPSAPSAPSAGVLPSSGSGSVSESVSKSMGRMTQRGGVAQH
jgi:hypothetical protein